MNPKKLAKKHPSSMFSRVRKKKEAMSDLTSTYVEKFWHLIDVMMNAILFVLIGLKILSIRFEWSFLWLSLLMIPLLILCRYIALSIPFRILSICNESDLIHYWSQLCA